MTAGEYRHRQGELAWLVIGHHAAGRGLWVDALAALDLALRLRRADTGGVSMKAFDTYEEAKTFAQSRADELGMDLGVEGPELRGVPPSWPKSFQTWTVRILQRPEHRFGHEARMEAVRPTNPPESYWRPCRCSICTCVRKGVCSCGKCSWR